MSKIMLQVQPQYALGEEWKELAERENLFYEPLEFFMPQVLLDPGSYDEVMNWYQNSGRVRSLHGAFIDVNPGSGDPEFQRLSEMRCHESCEIARMLGASHVVLHSSCASFLRGAYLDSWADKCACFYEKLAAQYNLKICVENSQDIDPDPLCTLMKRCRDPRVCVCLDIGHVNYSHTAADVWFERLGDRIEYLHLSDNLGKFDDHLPLGRGTVDWKRIHVLWKALGRETPATFEVGNIDGVEKSLTYLKQQGYFGMGE